eukprot:5244846-Amphidinium_carterae.1
MSEGGQWIKGMARLKKSLVPEVLAASGTAKLWFNTPSEMQQQVHLVWLHHDPQPEDHAEGAASQCAAAHFSGEAVGPHATDWVAALKGKYKAKARDNLGAAWTMSRWWRGSYWSWCQIEEK